ncbi:hypothetical protein N7539_007200 [Penicillium diatomitis]|uniref:Uncharacterized protein n=1 Tax=Penicillium diatomitis TaxID=2819901 RepID=A0A9W9WUN6_9EURO|nr:uncharacterized protein N7539_007200 [Penicillium diatomitis]KAJ5477056.1 hypothetical protein N7539_007200 [Penicillium diatomitis]
MRDDDSSLKAARARSFMSKIGAQTSATTRSPSLRRRKEPAIHDQSWFTGGIDGFANALSGAIPWEIVGCN